MSRPKKFKYLRNCERCGSVTNRITCEDCLKIAAYFPGEGPAHGAWAARTYGISYFYADCPIHGMSEFVAKTEKCVICEPPRGKTARTIARRDKRPAYRDWCDMHGMTDHGTNTGKCLTCYTSVGRERVSAARGRPTTLGLRAISRREGRSWYFGRCETHGSTPHAVSHGRCLTCYTATGDVRRQAAGGRPRSPGRSGEP